MEVKSKGKEAMIGRNKKSHFGLRKRYYVLRTTAPQTWAKQVRERTRQRRAVPKYCGRGVNSILFEDQEEQTPYVKKMF